MLDERRRVAREGWGAGLLSLQDPEGTWGGGLYNPKWTSTTYSMLLLRDLGLLPNITSTRASCERLLNEGLRSDGGVNFGAKASETCITGMILSIVSYFQYEDARAGELVRYLLREQMTDGGWNCRRRLGATHSSVHTTINVLEGLHLQEGGQRSVELRRAAERGREFLLQHRLFRSHRTGRVIRPEFTRLSFPPRWHYDILRALEHFRAVDAPRDTRLAEAVELVRNKMRPDGCWVLENSYRGRSFFELERVGQPSRWNTLRALRVLHWWDVGTRAPSKPG
ncbi:MAG TPA: prenyltransferase/squalene oxidase repeat-containing protein [Polyangiaceae bacterium]|nr:prenyltransferase/squalene oxidase repeat-containing protein [Polyangiaceae bacterium]